MLEDILLILNDNSITNEEKVDKLSDYHDNDLALSLLEMDTKTRMYFYSLFSEERLSDIIAYLDDPKEILEEMGLDKAADVLEEMDSDDAVDVLETLEEDHADKILELMDSDSKEDIELIQSYTDDEVGSLMTTNFIVISKTDDVKGAMKKLVKEAGENDNVSLIYVLDENDLYYGQVELRDLFIARADTPLESIIKTTYPSFYGDELVSDAYPTLTDYDLPSYPVLDRKNHLIGVITSTDIINLIGEELNEDFQMIAGIVPTEEENVSSLKSSVKSRFPWLSILLVLGVFISLVISLFSDVISSISVLIFFQSLVLGMSGNVGTQSLGVTVRVLSDNKVTGKDLFKLVLKESRVGFLNGLILGIISTTIITLFIYLTKLEIAPGVETSFVNSLLISGLIGISMTVAMCFSSFSGTIIPIIFKKIHIDPAVASGPFITTINDVIAVLIYYGLAYLLISIIM